MIVLLTAVSPFVFMANRIMTWHFIRAVEQFLILISFDKLERQTHEWHQIKPSLPQIKSCFCWKNGYQFLKYINNCHSKRNLKMYTFFDPSFERRHSSVFWRSNSSMCFLFAGKFVHVGFFAFGVCLVAWEGVLLETHMWKELL